MKHRVLITGASGTVGQAILELLSNYNCEIISIGRHSPFKPSKKGTHFKCDFLNESQLEQTCNKIKKFPAINLAIFCAGIDSYIGLRNFQKDIFHNVLQVNCIAHIQLLQAIRTQLSPSPHLSLVFISSNVLEENISDSLVYATSKIAMEEAIRNFITEEPSSRSLTIRLPFIGIPMSEIAEEKQATRTFQETLASKELNKALMKIEKFLFNLGGGI